MRSSAASPKRRSFSFESLTCKFQRAAVLCHCADDLIGSTTRNFCVDLQCDFDGGVHQSSEMRNDLISDAAGVAAYAGGIQRDAAVEASGTMPRWFWRRRSRFWAFGRRLLFRWLGLRLQ